MPTAFLYSLVSARSTLELMLWGITFLTILIFMGIAIRQEKRKFQQLNKKNSWLWLRLWSPAILLATAAVIIVPTQIIHGPEALGIFYLGVFTTGPLIWFGLHFLLGWLASPRLIKSESMIIAWNGLGLLIIPALIINFMNSPIFLLQHRWQQHQRSQTEVLPLAHHIQPIQRFNLGSSGILITQSLLAPAGIMIDHIESLSGDYWSDTQTHTHPWFCRQDNHIHLAWFEDTLPPPLRIHWHYDEKTNKSDKGQSEFRINTAAINALPIQDFSIQWRNDGIDLPVPINRSQLQLGWLYEGKQLYYRDLNMLQTGESFFNDCVMQGYQRQAWQTEGPIVAVKVNFYPKPISEFLKPEANN